MTDNARKTGPAIEAHFQFLMWLVPAVESFPECFQSVQRRFSNNCVGQAGGLFP
jgi:hypothetical protein